MAALPPGRVPGHLAGRGRPVAIGVVLWLLAAGAALPAQAAGSEWAIVAYISGDSSLEPTALAYAAELGAIPASRQVEVAVQLDRIDGYSNAQGDVAEAERFVFRAPSAGKSRQRVASGWRAEVNMGAPESLCDFVEWAVGECRAQRYLLLIMGHGTGVRALQADERAKAPPSGVAYDATSDGDCLTVRELGEACRRIADVLGGRLSVLALDACFSATMELGCEVAPHVECLSGSPGLIHEPGTPWDRVGRRLAEAPTMPPCEVAKAIVEAVQERQGESGNPRGSYLAAELRGMEGVQRQTGRLADSLRGRMDKLAPLVTAARAEAQTAGLHSELLDFSGFLRGLARTADEAGEREVAGTATSAADGADAALLAQFTGAEEARGGPRGWAVFFPPGLTVFPPDYLDTGTFAQDVGWGAFLSAYLGHLRNLVTPTAWAGAEARA